MTWRRAPDSMPSDLKIKQVAHHRNGVGGVPFHVVLFQFRDDTVVRNMMAIVMPEEMKTAVLDVDQTAAGNVAFGAGNSWSGDQFDKELRQADAAYERMRTDLPVSPHDAPDLDMIPQER